MLLLGVCRCKVAAPSSAHVFVNHRKAIIENEWKKKHRIRDNDQIEIGTKEP